MKLNKEQKKAVEICDCPLLIVAGAGSGKTRVIIEKIKYLIEQKIVKPYHILAITFTNKAAKEMRDRLANALPDKLNSMQISTFHSLGLRIIREQIEHLNLNPKFSIMDSDDSLSIIKKIMKKMEIDQYKDFSPYYAKEQISRAKNDLVCPATFSELSKISLDKSVAEVYHEYEAILAKHNAIDFDDLLVKPYLLLKENKEVRKHYQKKFQYILVDEYQDTNEVQYRLIKLLVSKNRICVVADTDQSIYSWRGANYYNVMNFEKDFPDAKVIMLEQNYRSTNTILESANCIIRNNPNRKEKKLWSELGQGEKLEYYICDDERGEADQVIQIVKSIHQHNNSNLNDICILYRTNAQSRAIEEAFLKNNIPYRMIGGFGFYNRKEIKDLIAYLRVINNPNDEISLLRIINEPKRQIGITTINRLIDKANRQSMSIFDTIDLRVTKDAKFKQLIVDLQKKVDKVNLTDFVDLVLDKTGLLAQYQNGTLEDEIRADNLQEFKSITKSFESMYEDVTLANFLTEISLLTDAKFQDQDDAVTLMTMHAAKGLEYEHILVVGMEESIMPHLKSLEDKEALEEERRLCYVAITRAKKNCYLFNAKKRTLFGQLRTNPVSRFIGEIDEKYIDKKIISKSFNFNNIKKKSDTKNVEFCSGFKVGDKVIHKLYGEGMIVEVQDKIATIIFDTEIKKIMISNTYIRRID